MKETMARAKTKNAETSIKIPTYVQDKDTVDTRRTDYNAEYSMCEYIHS